MRVVRVYSCEKRRVADAVLSRVNKIILGAFLDLMKRSTFGGQVLLFFFLVLKKYFEVRAARQKQNVLRFMHIN